MRELLVQRGSGTLHGADHDKVWSMDHHPDDHQARELLFRQHRSAPRVPTTSDPHAETVPFVRDFLQIFTRSQFVLFACSCLNVLRNFLPQDDTGDKVN